MSKKSLLLFFFLLAMPTLPAFAQQVATFNVRIENVSSAGTLQPSDGSQQAVPLSPGVWVVHADPEALFTSGEQDRGQGLEAIAEDGNPTMLDSSLQMQSGIVTARVFNTPAGGGAPAPLGPGDAYEFSFQARSGQRLSFASMFVPSNDLFYAPAESGIELFDAGGQPISGDLTAMLMLWDAGTEENQEPGVGPDQVQRQSGPNTGAPDPDNTVRLVDDGFTYPEVTEVIKLTIESVTAMPFRMRIENVSSAGTLQPSDGSQQAVPLSPGVWAVHDQAAPLFSAGEVDRGDGLEAIAEDGNPTMLAEILPSRSGIIASGVFNTPVDAEGPGPIGPEGAYEVTFYATPGQSLSFASMFVPSNDLFYAPDEAGIALFDENDVPVSGQFVSSLSLWDAGTEENQEPGVGPDQVQRQSGPNTGAADPDSLVRLVNDGFTYPDKNEVVSLSITPLMATTFTVQIENVSTVGTLQPSDGSQQPVPLSPGVWAVHSDSDPLFTNGEPDRGDGLEAIAEDGNPASLSSSLLDQAGIAISDLFNIPVGAQGPGPIGPGGMYEFSFEAVPGQSLAFATMFVPSNDLFYSPDGSGISLFDEQGEPVSGEVTAMLSLWDAGTEINQEPGVGPDQVQRQAAPNTGAADPNNTVRLVDDGFTYPEVAEVIRVTINASPTSVAGDDRIGPREFQLMQNYPNPFNPQTSIVYSLQEAGRVRLTVYNFLGQRIIDLVDEVQAAGEYTVRWDGRNLSGRRVASGFYLYRLDFNERSLVRKMTLLK